MFPFTFGSLELCRSSTEDVSQNCIYPFFRNRPFGLSRLKSSTMLFFTMHFRASPSVALLFFLLCSVFKVHPRDIPSKLHNARGPPFPVSRTSDLECVLLSAAHALLRKEVIQPLVLERLPCYDFTPMTKPTFGRVLLAVRLRTSGVPGSHGVTGGVYKARERIHRGMLIRDY